MFTKKRGIIGETPTEARQTDPGPSVIALLPISDLAVMVLGDLWFAFFRRYGKPAGSNRRVSGPVYIPFIPPDFISPIFWAFM